MQVVDFVASGGENFDKTFRDHSPTSLGRLANRLSLTLNFLFVDESFPLDLEVQLFIDILVDIYNECCPIRTKRVSWKNCNKGWLTRELLLDIDRKHAIYRDYRQNRISFQLYKCYKNMLTCKIKRIKKMYYHQKFSENCGDMRTTWSTINSLMGRSDKSSKERPNINDFKSDNLLNNVDLCNSFNEYFSSIGSRLNDSIISNGDPLDSMPERNRFSFFVEPCDDSEVQLIISGLSNSSSNSEGLPVFIYKFLKCTLSPFIVKFFNQSVSDGVFPAPFKIAKVSPIFKSGEASLFTNYRPISVLNTISKIFEKLIHKRLSSFLSRCNIIVKNQFGFMKGRSTNDAIVEFLNDCHVSLEKKEHIIAVCLDLSKAFDTLDTGILLRKLDRLGVRGVAHSWFESYLSNRCQYVSLCSDKSDIRYMTTGVPQGSVLGPLLFNLYINEMSNVCNTQKFIHYADDTTLYSSNNNINTLVTSINLCLARLTDWLKCNKLHLNINKTCCLMISNSLDYNSLPTVTVNDDVISYVECVKFLGVLIDRDLNFKAQVDSLCKKMSRSIGAIRRINFLVTDDILVKMYFALVYPYLTYGVLSWGQSSVTNSNRVARIQQSFFNIIIRRGCLHPQLTYKLMPFVNIYKYFACLKLFQCINSNTHQYFNELITDHLPSHIYRTRFSSNNNILLPQHRLSSTHISFIYNAISIWNTLPTDLKSLNSYSSFKVSLKKYFLQ